MEDNKVCPKCGMQLVGKNNYCMGCGVNVDLTVHDASLGNDGEKKVPYVQGAGYGGGLDYLERLRVAEGRREKRKRRRNIFSEGGLATVLLLLLGSIAGLVVGLFLLKTYFGPKDVTKVFLREKKVVELANVEHIDPPKEKEFNDGPTVLGTIDLRRKKDQSAETMQEMPKSSKKEADPNKETFQGTITIWAYGDKVTEWKEEEVWDVTGLDEDSVSYVVNRLHYQYDELYQGKIFVDFEIMQTPDVVTITTAFHHLELEANLMELARMNVIGTDQVVENGKTRYLSLKKTRKALDGDGWQESGAEPKTTVIYVE